MKRTAHKIFCLAVFIFSSSNALFAQSKSSCEALLKQKINMSSRDAFLKDVYRIMICDVDSIDMQLVLTPRFIETFKSRTGNKKATFGDFMNLITDFRGFPFYSEAREKTIAANYLKSKKVDMNSWTADREYLVKIGLNSIEINDFHYFLIQHKDTSWTYFEASELFTDDRAKEKSQSALKSKTEYFNNITTVCDLSSVDTLSICKFNFEKNNSAPTRDTVGNYIVYNEYEKGIQCANKLNRPVLLFFNAFAAVNCKKMEDKVLSDGDVMDIIQQKFVFINLYVDDKSVLPQSDQYNSEDGRLVNTLGKRNSDLQMKTFGTNAQPYFYVVDKDGKAIKTAGGLVDLSNFKRFLEEALRSFK
jgi:thioredoxin-related protein